MDDLDDHDRHLLDRLKWALQALAHPAEVQSGLYPDFVCLPDELTLEFDDAYRTVGQFSMTKEQRSLLDSLKASFAFLSKSENAFWSKEALPSTELWQRVRRLARDCLILFGWPLGPPPLERATYVKG